MAQQGTRNVNQTLPYLRNAAQAKSRKDKGYMPTSIGYGPVRCRKYKTDIAIP